MGWNYLFISKLHRLHRWSLGIENWFHPTIHNGYNLLSMLGLSLSHVSASRQPKPGLLHGSAIISFKSLWLLWSGHDDVIKWKHFPRYWPFVRGIHRSPVNSPHTKASDNPSDQSTWRTPMTFVNYIFQNNCMQLKSLSIHGIAKSSCIFIVQCTCK